LNVPDIKKHRRTFQWAAKPNSQSSGSYYDLRGLENIDIGHVFCAKPEARAQAIFPVFAIFMQQN